MTCCAPSTTPPPASCRARKLPGTLATEVAGAPATRSTRRFAACFLTPGREPLPVGPPVPEARWRHRSQAGCSPSTARCTPLQPGRGRVGGGRSPAPVVELHPLAAVGKQRQQLLITNHPSRRSIGAPYDADALLSSRKVIGPDDHRTCEMPYPTPLSFRRSTLPGVLRERGRRSLIPVLR